MRARDAYGNDETAGGLTVGFQLGSNASGVSSGTISAVKDNGDGTYTATFTGVDAGTANTIVATIGGSGNNVTSTLPTVTVSAGKVERDQVRADGVAVQHPGGR